MKRAILLLLPTLSACVNLAGLEGKSEFACKAPDGVVCTSVSGVYANALAGALPAQQSQDQDPDQAKATREAVEGEPKPYAATVSVTSTPAPGTPLLSPPKVLRLWLAPRLDADGDLHDASYLYVMWHRGEWQIEHTRRQIQRQFTPVSAPITSRATDASARKDSVRQDARDTVLEAARHDGQSGSQVNDDDR